MKTHLARAGDLQAVPRHLKRIPALRKRRTLATLVDQRAPQQVRDCLSLQCDVSMGRMLQGVGAWAACLKELEHVLLHVSAMSSKRHVVMVCVVSAAQ